jgi:hypothetical protein
MSIIPQSEFIWQGRIHLGDEPGVYGDAHYSGLCTELPVTIFRLDPTKLDDLPFTLILNTEDVATFAGYPGHEIIVTAYELDPTKPFNSVERLLARERLTSTDNNRKEVTVRSGTTTGLFYISVRLRIDTTVNPGLYDDFVFTRLSLSSENFSFFASFGFKNP